MQRFLTDFHEQWMIVITRTSINCLSLPKCNV